MESVQHALSQIRQIREQLHGAEMYRGVRAAVVAATGLAAFLAAAAQWAWFSALSPKGFVWFWATIAAINSSLSSGAVAWRYLFHSSPRERGVTRRMVGQFIPSLAAGTLITGIIYVSRPELIPLLPGLWCVLYGLGLFSIRPQMPRAIGWAGLFFFLSGGVILRFFGAPRSLSPWCMGAVFGCGQLLIALILYWNLERKSP